MKNIKQGRILLHLNIIAVLVTVAFFSYIYYSLDRIDIAIYMGIAACCYAFNIILLGKMQIRLVGVLSILYSDLLVLIYDAGYVKNTNNSTVLYIPLLIFCYVVTDYKDKVLRAVTVGVTILCLLLVTYTDITPKLGAVLQPQGMGFEALTTFNLVVAIICSVMLVRTIVRTNYKMEEAMADAKETAEQSLKEKNRFLSIMSHEIRTPANAIVGMTHLLKEKGVPDVLKRDVQLLHYSSQHLKSLIDNVLYYNNLEMGKIDIEVRPFDIRKLCHNAVESFVLEAAKKHIELRFDFDDRIPQFVLGDYEKLVLVLHNLLSNAIKFTKKGEVFLLVKMNHIDEKKCYVIFKVADTGIGISGERMTHIFSVFNQLDSAITRSHDGMGLGLAISKRLLKLMNTTLHADSEEGVGATFFFEVGLGLTTEVKDAEQRFIETHDLAGIRILLVEDNKLNVLVAKKILENLKATIEVAKHGAEALEQMRNKKYDIVLMDLHMPVMDGFEATEKLREYDRLTPVIAFTADAYEDARQRAKDVGMNDFVTKPFDPELLYNKIITNLTP
jgi:signal transduction histidine kinase/CheY-like chemotaxis protein